MSSSSSTTPAKNPGAGGGRQRALPSRSRTLWTWALLSVWSALMLLGAVSLAKPEWLESAARGGRRAEAHAYRHYGDNELKKGNFKLAIAQYLHALEIRPDVPEVLVNLGVAYLRLGDLPHAKSALLRAARLETSAGTQSAIALTLGEMSEREGSADDAIRHYQEALSLGARPSPVYQKLGTLYLRNRHYEGAQEAFEKILEQQTDPLQPYRDMLHRSRERAEEDAETQQWLQTDGSQEPGEADWARYDLESIRQMHTSDPEIAKTHNHLGLISYHIGDLERAIYHFEQSLTIWPNNTDAVRNLRILKSERGRPGS